jgi:PPOX class probable F420-dependent enzyme
MLGIGAGSRSTMPVGPPTVSGPTTTGGFGDGVKRRSQIQMSPAETQSLLSEARTMTMCTFNHDGTIHAVAMWYGFLGDDIAIETKAKSQKAVNLRRDPRITCLVESGEGYNELRGVELVGWAELIEEPARLWEIGVSVFERHVAPYNEGQHRSQVEAMLHNRVGVRVHANRIVTWDHRKLGAPPAGRAQ